MGHAPPDWMTGGGEEGTFAPVMIEGSASGPLDRVRNAPHPERCEMDQRGHAEDDRGEDTRRVTGTEDGNDRDQIDEGGRGLRQIQYKLREAVGALRLAEPNAQRDAHHDAKHHGGAPECDGFHRDFPIAEEGDVGERGGHEDRHARPGAAQGDNDDHRHHRDPRRPDQREADRVQHLPHQQNDPVEGARAAPGVVVDHALKPTGGAGIDVGIDGEARQPVRHALDREAVDGQRDDHEAKRDPEREGL